MTSTVFASGAEAERSLVANKFVFASYTGGEFKRATAPHDSDAYLKDYAAIAQFLCNAPAFEDALRRVSAQLWDAYRAFPQKMRNKFSRAMGKVAMAKGFQFHDHLTVETPPISIMLTAGDPLLGRHVRARLFWKDSMDSRHGEHSHSLQWLAIAEHGGTTNAVPELYANTVNYWAPTKDSSRKLKVPLWSWLADCFPTDMKKLATEQFLNGETLESNSYRCPQVIMDYLLSVNGNRAALSDHFVANYLYHRYRNRRWLAETPDGTVTSIQEKAINVHREAERASHGWTQQGPRARRVQGYDPGSHATTVGAQKHTHQFHGKGGTMIFFYTE